MSASWSKNAYIIVAMDGTPLFTSGKRIYQLIGNNLTDVLALNFIGDCAMFLGKVFVVLITGFLSFAMIDVSWMRNLMTDYFTFVIFLSFKAS